MADTPLLLVPAGAEARAVRRGAARLQVVAFAPGAGARTLSPLPPGAIVVLGLCGALRGGAVGETVCYRGVRDDRERFALPPPSRAAGRMVDAFTAEAVVTGRAERLALAQRFAADVVDMEGTHLVRALAALGREAAMVRVVSDAGDYDLPPIGDAIDAQGRLRPLRLALGFARAPRGAARFVADVRRALTALEAVAAALTAA